MANISQKVPWREKIGYSLGDSSANFVFQIMMMFQLGFYTDVFGITASAAGTILLLARIIDAFVDPMAGILADRTNTRWGKYRPWILWTAIPFGIFFVLTFTTPDIGEKMKIVYAGITYTLLMSVYSLNNTPYGALLGVISSDMKERTRISSVRFIFAMAASFVVQGLTLPLVSKFGQGNDQRGWTLTIALFASIAIIFFIITFFASKERISPPPGQKTSVKQDMKDIINNGPWRSMFALTLFIFITLSMWGGGMYYYFGYFVDKGALFTFLQKFGLVNISGESHGAWHGFLNSFGLIAQEDQGNVFEVGFSFFNMLGQLINIIGIILLAGPLSNRFGKRSTFIVGLFLTAVFTGLFMTAKPDRVGYVYLLNLLKSLAYAPTIPLLWSMMADVADYSEWKYARRATGFVFAGIVFALKAGLGFGGAICGWIVNAFGYVPNAIQDTRSILGIRLASSIIPASTFFIGVITLFTYKITKKFNEEIQTELAQRRKK